MSTEPLDATLTDDLVEFINRYYRDGLTELAQGYPRDTRSLTISWQDLRQFDPALADEMLRKPTQARAHLSEAITLVDLPLDIDLSGAAVRVTDLPDSRTFYADELRHGTVWEQVAVSGQVSNRTGVRPAPEVAAYECQRCGTVTEVRQDLFAADVQEPHECTGCERQGPFDIKKQATELHDIQLAQVQVPPERSAGGGGMDLDVLLEGDQAGSIDAGDRVTITGTHETQDDDGVGFAHQLHADHVTVEESTFSGIDIDDHRDEIDKIANGEYGGPFDLVVDSIAPSIVGMETVKQALALQLFGGVRTESPDGTSTRGDIHVLLIGDPGTAKSSFLEDVEHKAPNAMMASGKGATAAGLTAAAEQTEFAGHSQWSLAPGAMVLADDGIACIDELDKVPDDAVESLHQALSKQTVAINKGPIDAQLRTRTAVLAAGNPKFGRFDKFEPIAEQIDLSPTLLSRFDIIWPVNDEPDPESDIEIAEGMMDHHDQSIRYERGDLDATETDIAPAIPRELLRAYIAHAKDVCKPRWPEGEPRQELIEGFVELRKAGAGDDQPIPVTFRAIESQRRLAEASARLRLSDTVTADDVSRARELYLTAMRQVGVDPETDRMDADVIETGSSKNQRERVKDILDIVDELQGEYDQGAPIEKVIERGEEAGIEEPKVRHDIANLKDKGAIYSPARNHLRTT
jgi:replicative DNA helicase Mcm